MVTIRKLTGLFVAAALVAGLGIGGAMAQYPEKPITLILPLGAVLWPMLNGCSYCVGHNTALGLSLGYTDDKIDALAGDFRNSDLFTPAEKAAIAWAEYLTERTYRQHPHAIDDLKRHSNDAQIVEITMVSGFFNFWNRFVDSLQVELEPQNVVGNIKKSREIDPEDYVAFMRDCWWGEKQHGE